MGEHGQGQLSWMEEVDSEVIEKSRPKAKEVAGLSTAHPQFSEKVLLENDNKKNSVHIVGSNIEQPHEVGTYLHFRADQMETHGC